MFYLAQMFCLALTWLFQLVLMTLVKGQENELPPEYRANMDERSTRPCQLLFLFFIILIVFNLIQDLELVPFLIERLVRHLCCVFLFVVKWNW